MYKKYEILKLLVSFCRFVNLQIVRTKTFIRKRRLYNRNVLGSHTPQSLLNTLIWLNNSVQFEHQTLRLLHIFYYKISSY
jgi:hypothetical protein